MATDKRQHRTTDLSTRLDARTDRYLAELDRKGSVADRVRAQVRTFIRRQTPAPVPERNRTGMVEALFVRRTPIYAGTVPAKVVAKRRARNRMARASRKANR